MTLREQFEKETGEDAILKVQGVEFRVNDNYTKWLEEKLSDEKLNKTTTFVAGEIVYLWYFGGYCSRVKIINILDAPGYLYAKVEHVESEGHPFCVPFDELTRTEDVPEKFKGNNIEIDLLNTIKKMHTGQCSNDQPTM